MITRKRIAELIEKESGCYVLNDYSIGYVHLKLKYEPELYVNGEDGYILYIYGNDKKDTKMEIFDEDLFETKEEAEWHKEFGCIERTERLELPTWEEIQCKFDKKQIVEKYYYYSKHFYKPNRDVNNIDNTYSIYLMPSGFIIIDDNEEVITLFKKPLTKENYILACRKAKELFLGDENE